MPMLRFLIRKMWNTRLLTGSTLVGLILAVAFTTSIPMYADGSLKRVVTKTLEEKNDGLPAGSLLIRYQAAGADKAEPEAIDDVNRYIREQIPKDIGFPHQTYAASFSIRSAQITPEDPSKVDASKRRQMTLTSLSGLKDHIEISGGQIYGDNASSDGVQAVIWEEAMFRSDIHIGDVFNYPLPSGVKGSPLKVKIVGTFKLKQENDPYWFQGMDGLLPGLFVSENVFTQDLINTKKIPLNLANWYYAFDLSNIETSRLANLTKTLNRLDINLYSKLKETRVDISFLEILDEFKKISLQLQILLFTLAAPMLGMVFYYIVMNARQSLERQRSDIAVLRSRGGSTRQIIRVYFLEGVILGGIALLVGPLLGWFMAKSIGSASGFLTFVDRKAVPIHLTKEAALYGLGSVVLAIAASVVPAVTYARSSIVGYKQQMARSDRKPIWQRWFMDIALLLASGYGWYLFNDSRVLSLKTGLGTDQMQVHPLLFFVPAVSIFALGLFFLRLFPWILRFFNGLGKRIFPVPIYLTLTQLSRSAKAYYPLMLLLILTLGLGVYNASAARTIDLNSTERTLYQYGTDVIIQTAWEGVSDDLPTNPDAGKGTGGTGGTGDAGGGQKGNGSGGQTGAGGQGNPGGSPGQGDQPPSKTRFIEPPFEMFRTMEGVDHAARVMQTKGNVTVSGKSLGTGMLVGVDNTDFANVAWFREDLFPAHPNRYLNLLSSYEQAVIIPSKLAEKYQLKEGDLISIGIQQQPVEFVIVGILPYWPGQYPDQTPFFIANLDYIYDQVPLIPYEVWLKMKEGAKTAPILEALKAKNIEWVSVKDVRTELVKQNKQPTRGGVFGILSLGFLVSILVSLIGYILYWFFNLSSRVVQFGVLRAMGLKRKQLTRMLLLEQIFTAGLSIAVGIGAGKLAGYLYLPFLQTAENVKTQVPPFRVVFEAKDAYPLYGVVAVMMMTGATILVFHIRRLRVHQAVKMGEER